MITNTKAPTDQAGAIAVNDKIIPPFANYARSFLERGWYIFPLRPFGKEPITPHGFKDASNDPKQITDWIERFPNSNIGVATEVSNLIVIDCDSAKGETPPGVWDQPGITDGVDVFCATADVYGSKVNFETYIVKTPNNGWHFYFSAQDRPEKSGASVNGLWRVDVRSKGGYIVAAGSQLETGIYEPSLTINEVAPCDDWVRQAISPKIVQTTKITTTTYKSSKRWVDNSERSILNQFQYLRSATTGTRNQTLNKVSFICGSIVAKNGHNAEGIIPELLNSALSIGLSEREALSTIASAFKAGLESNRGQ